MDEKHKHAREDLIFSLKQMVEWFNALPFEAAMAPITHRDFSAFVTIIIEILE